MHMSLRVFMLLVGAQVGLALGGLALIGASDPAFDPPQANLQAAALTIDSDPPQAIVHATTVASVAAISR